MIMDAKSPPPGQPWLVPLPLVSTSHLFAAYYFTAAKIAGLFQLLDELFTFSRNVRIGIIRPSGIETANRQKHENRKEHPINFGHCSPLWFRRACIQAVLARLHNNGLCLGIGIGGMDIFVEFLLFDPR